MQPRNVPWLTGTPLRDYEFVAGRGKPVQKSNNEASAVFPTAESNLDLGLPLLGQEFDQVPEVLFGKNLFQPFGHGGQPSFPGLNVGPLDRHDSILQ